MPTATVPRLIVPPSSADVVVTKISPTVLSTDLLSPQQFRVTLPTIGQCERERVAQSWGTHAVRYGGVGGLPFLGESRLKDFPVGRSHRHFRSGFSEYKTTVQPHRRTELTLSESRINDQLLPPPPHKLIWDKRAEAPWPQNDAYWSHSPVFEVFPDGPKRSTAAKDLGPVTRKALQDLRKKDGMSTYQEAHCDNIKDRTPPSKTQQKNQGPLQKLTSKRLKSIKSARRRRQKSAKTKGVTFKDGGAIKNEATLGGIGPSWPPSTDQVIDKFLLKERSALDVPPEAFNKRNLQPIDLKPIKPNAKSGRTGKLPRVPDKSEGVKTAIPMPATAHTLPLLALVVKNLPEAIKAGGQPIGATAVPAPPDVTSSSKDAPSEDKKTVRFENTSDGGTAKKEDDVTENAEEEEDQSDETGDKDETEEDPDEKKKEEEKTQLRARSLPEGFFGKRRLLKLGNWNKSDMHQRFIASCPETIPDLRDGLTYPARKRHFFYGSHSCVFRG
ncbi:Hypp8871 [Branchiostoma lanceolatum]|uniref:Hypp8871 protein n=1 Tax=Branchiostoma lanceolatum TaxID=7740 RepID=A0A8J9Z9W1_BRALA|nr:Hypp8871 [Branchiostoma lanceolatum]